ncbi:MAG: NYN domain-containing protein [Christensenellaceae bacterium]|nr:NYN domain-containing protein [Christensenellaceae bacterium]
MTPHKPRMVILADIASLKITCEGFKSLVEEISKDFDVVDCKFYNYNAKRNRDYKEYIAENSFDTFAASASKRRNKLDSAQLISAIDVVNSRDNKAFAVSAAGFITGDGDILPLINVFKGKGIDIYDINVVQSKYNEMYSGFINVPESALKEGYKPRTDR